MKLIKGKDILILLLQGKYGKKNIEALKWLHDGYPKTAIEIYKQILEKIPYNKSKRRALYLNNLGVSYVEDGNNAAAVDIWEKLILEPDCPYPKSVSWKCLLHYNLAYRYLVMGRENDFLNQFEILKNIIREDDPNNLNHNVQGFIDEINMKYSVYQGEYEKPLAYYQSCVYKAKQLSDKCFHVYQLSLIYKKSGEPEKQAVCLRFLAEKGNDLYIARAARECLDKMPEQLRGTDKDIYSILPLRTYEDTANGKHQSRKYL
jgi:tetratricopeptide (TPR) repeat protein